jgi:type I restriction enzyme S subunit
MEKMWVQTLLRDVSDILPGFGFPKSMQGESNGKYPFYKVGDISKSVQNGSIYLKECDNYINDNKLKIIKGKLLPKGTVVFAKIGEALKLNRRAITTAPCLVDNNVVGVKANNSVLLDGFLYFFLKRVKLEEYSRATTVPSVRKTDIEKISFNLPPIPEQRAIVSKVEQLFSDLDNGIDNFKKAQEQLKRYRQSVLKAACEGRLVPTEAELACAEGRDYEPADVLLARILKERREKWEDDQIVKFKDKGKIPTNNKWITKFKAPISPNIENLPNLPEGWTWTSPDQISSWDDPYSFAIGPFGSNLKVSDYMSQGVPLVFVRNIRSGIFRDDKTKYVSDVKAKELRPHWISSGDILITKMGDPPGDSYLYPDGLPNAIITADCIKLRLCNLSSNQYFLNAIKSQIVRSQINSITKGVAQ